MRRSIDIELHRLGSSFLRVHTWRVLKEIDNRGYYKSDRHAIVSVVISEIFDIELLGFNKQNVVSGIVFEKTDDGVKMTLGGCFGVEGYIVAEHFAFEIETGTPPGSIYAKSI